MNATSKLGTRIRIASRGSAAILEYCFNSRGHRANWQEYGINFIMALDVFYYNLDRNEEN
jgi:hypothetical protein